MRQTPPAPSDADAAAEFQQKIGEEMNAVGRFIEAALYLTPEAYTNLATAMALFRLGGQLLVCGDGATQSDAFAAASAAIERVAKEHKDHEHGG